MTKRFILQIATLLLCTAALAQSIEIEKPRLVVNIVVSGMRAVDLERYQANIGLNGLRLLYEEGVRYENCQYNYQQTTTPVSLATLSTGALPSTHGIVGESWFDYVTGEEVDLLADEESINIEYPSSQVGYSPVNLLVPTLSEALLGDSPQSAAVSIALDPLSAIVTSGGGGLPFWFDAYSCNWASSTAYTAALPEWVTAHNRTESDIARTSSKWTMSMHSDLYFNGRYTDQKGGYILGNAARIRSSEDRRQRYDKYYKQIISSPIGNEIVAEFAKLAVVNQELGADESVDLLNICFDATRNIVECYGAQSIEAEDMYYKLDRTLADLIKFINSQVAGERVVYILSSDRGTSPSVAIDKNRFNYRQFEVILNGFLSVRYGSEKWVLGCRNGAIYLNRNAIYKHNLKLSEVQGEASAFALQLQGVSHAISSTALSASYFGNGYAQKVQNGFYPRRSGDVILNLMPSWIESDRSRLSQSGSMYNYDRAVPLVVYTKGIAPKVITRSVDPISIAPTLATIMGVTEPAACEGSALEEFNK